MAMCKKCHSRIGAADIRKQVSAYVQADGSLKYYGLMPLPPVSSATGKLKAVYHYKCYFVIKKAERIGPNGKYFDESPGIYEASDAYKNKDDFTEVALTRRQIAEARLADLERREIAGEHIDAQVNIGALIEEAQAEVALAVRQEEIDAENAKEEVPDSWADWREPQSFEV